MALHLGVLFRFRLYRAGNPRILHEEHAQIGFQLRCKNLCSGHVLMWADIICSNAKHGLMKGLYLYGKAA